MSTGVISRLSTEVCPLLIRLGWLGWDNERAGGAEVLLPAVTITA